MFESLLSLFWGRYSEVDLLGHVVIAFLVFQGPATLFPRPPFYRHLSSVPMSASLPPPRLLLLCLHSCPLSCAHQGPFFSLCPNAWPSWDLGSGLLSDPQSHPWCLHSLCDLLPPRPLPQTCPCGSGLHPPTNINTSGQPLGLGRDSPSLVPGVPHRRQQRAAGRSWGWRAGGTGCPLPAAGTVLEEQAGASLGTYTFPPTFPA